MTKNTAQQSLIQDYYYVCQIIQVHFTVFSDRLCKVTFFSRNYFFAVMMERKFAETYVRFVTFPSRCLDASEWHQRARLIALWKLITPFSSSFLPSINAEIISLHFYGYKSTCGSPSIWRIAFCEGCKEKRKARFFYLILRWFLSVSCCIVSSIKVISFNFSLMRFFDFRIFGAKKEILIFRSFKIADDFG